MCERETECDQMNPTHLFVLSWMLEDWKTSATANESPTIKIQSGLLAQQNVASQGKALGHSGKGVGILLYYFTA